MHSLRLLTLLLPELKLIDSLVVRDFYHRFTVDEHSFLAIESLHRLKQSKSEWDKRYAELLGELEDPELYTRTDGVRRANELSAIAHGSVRPSDGECPSASS